MLAELQLFPSKTRLKGHILFLIQNTTSAAVCAQGLWGFSSTNTFREMWRAGDQSIWPSSEEGKLYKWMFGDIWKNFENIYLGKLSVFPGRLQNILMRV